MSGSATEAVSETSVPPELLQGLQIEDDSLQGFAAEYQKLQESLQTAMKSESKFLSRCREAVGKKKDMRKKIAEGEHAIQKHREILHNTIKEMDKTKERITSTEEEKKQKEDQIEDLREKLLKCDDNIATTSANIDQRQKEKIAKLEERLAEQRTNRDSNNDILTKKRQENLIIHEKKTKIFEEKVELEKAISILEEKSSDVEMLCKKETERKQSLSIAVSDLDALMQQRQENTLEIINDGKRIERNIENERRRLENSISIIKELKSDISTYGQRIHEANKLVFEKKKANQRLASTVEDLEKELVFVTEKAKKTNREGKVFHKMILTTQEEIKIIEAQVLKGEKKKGSILEEITKLKAELKELQFKNGLVKKDKDALHREKECLRTEGQTKKSTLKKHEFQERMLLVQLKSINNDAHNYETNSKNLFLTINRLQQEHEGLEMECRKRRLQKQKAVVEVQKRSDVIAEKTIKIQEEESRIKTIARSLNSVKKERALYTEQLASQKGEMTEYNRTLGELSIRIRQLKQEIQDQDILILTEHLNMKHTKERLENLHQQCKRFTTLIAEKKKIIDEQKERITKVTKLIEVGEDEIHSQKKQYENVLGEQKLLNQQLTVKNGEVQKLHSQIHVQQSVLAKGEVAYQARMKEIVELRKQRDEIIVSLDEYRSEIEKFEELKMQIGQIQRDIIQEKLRTKALLDEMKKSVNIHRWRLLKDTDSEAYEKIKQVHALQQQIMRKSAKADSKDAMIRERERLYVELRRVLSRQPGKEAYKQLETYASALKQKRAKLKSMKSELKMYQARVYECKYDIEKINKDLELLKQEYFHRRMRETKEARIAEHERKRQEQMKETSDLPVPDSALEDFYRENPQLLHGSKPPEKADSDNAHRPPAMPA